MASYSYLIADSDPGGYDGQYTDVAALISAKQSTWVSGDDVTIWIGKYGIGGATTLTPPAGVTVLMQPLATHEHSGTPLATPHFQSWQHSNYLLRIAGSGVTVGGVHAKNTATGSSYGSPVVSFSSGAIVATVERCILVHGSTASTAACIGAASINASAAGLGAAQKVRGNLCIGGNTGIGTQDWEDVSGAVDNNTIVDAIVGIRLSSGATGFSPRNNTIYGCTNSMYSAGTWGSPAYNAASDVSTTALPGTNNYSSDVTAGDFENVSGNDYHLSASSGLIGQGANLYSSFTTDIDGDEWPSSGAWDIGFDYFTGGGGAYSLTADTGGFTATGTAAGLIASRKLAADSQSYALDGRSANLVRSFALLVESGDFTVSGGATSLLADRVLTAALGAYALSGIDASLTYTPVGSYSITADAGAFVFTGADAAILADRAFAADAQSYALTGIDAALAYTPSVAYSLAADSGSFALTGAAVTLTYTPAGSYNMPADSVAFGITGHDVGLLAGRVNAAEAGSFALTGIDAALAYGYSMPAESASFAMTCIDAGFSRTYQLTAELGEFTLAGVAATLRYSAAVTMSGRVQLERGKLRSIRSFRTLRT